MNDEQIKRTVAMVAELMGLRVQRKPVLTLIVNPNLKQADRDIGGREP